MRALYKRWRRHQNSDDHKKDIRKQKLIFFSASNPSWRFKWLWFSSPRGNSCHCFKDPASSPCRAPLVRHPPLCVPDGRAEDEVSHQTPADLLQTGRCRCSSGPSSLSSSHALFPVSFYKTASKDESERRIYTHMVSVTHKNMLFIMYVLVCGDEWPAGWFIILPETELRCLSFIKHLTSRMLKDELLGIQTCVCSLEIETLGNYCN